jgi:hypothetical protein
VVDGAFAANNPVFMTALLAAYQQSLEWVRANPAEAGTLAEKHELGLRAPFVAASIPRSNFVYVSAMEARPSIEALFRVFLEYAPSSIGGKLPGANFYYGHNGKGGTARVAETIGTIEARVVETIGTKRVARVVKTIGTRRTVAGEDRLP